MSTMIVRTSEEEVLMGFPHDLPGPERWHSVWYIEDVPDTASPDEVLEMIAGVQDQLAKIAVHYRIDFQELEAAADWLDLGVWDWDE